jgi:hypothetical protein
MEPRSGGVRYSGSSAPGLSARWSPAWLDGTLGFYGRNATDILPQVLLTQGFAAAPAGTCTAIGGIIVAPGACIINPQATSVPDLTQKGKAGTYRTAYGDNIHIYGITLAKSIGGVSVAGELSYRQNMRLNSIIIPVLPGPLAAATGSDSLKLPHQRGRYARPARRHVSRSSMPIAIVPKTWAWIPRRSPAN